MEDEICVQLVLFKVDFFLNPPQVILEKIIFIFYFKFFHIFLK